MSTVELLEPLLEKGIANTNFFNGRLLSAEDLRAEQLASRQQHQQLGRAVGDGIAYGLEVRQVTEGSPPGGSPTPKVRVAAGLAINRAGQALSLAEDTDVALVRKLDTVAAQAGLFAACEPQQTSALLTGKGVYILALAPASGFQGRAPMSGLGQTVASGSCGSRFAVEGVQFKLLSLNLSKITGVVQTLTQLNLLMASNTAINLSKLRNLLAHLSLGSEELKSFYGDPFGRDNGRPTYLSYGAADALRKEGSLSDCDVPLALLYWTTQGVQFLDMWPVRRRLAQRATTDDLPVLVGERRASEAEARLAQFDEHIEYLRANQTNLDSLIASQWFGFLPALGLLPIKGTGSPVGFNPQTFFGSRASKTTEIISGTILRALLRQSLDHDPIDLSGADEILLFSIAENLKAITDNRTNQMAALFVSSALRQAIFALTLSRRLTLTFSPAFFEITGKSNWFFKAGVAFFTTRASSLRPIYSETGKPIRGGAKPIEAGSKIVGAGEGAKISADEERDIFAISAQCLGWMPVKLPQGSRIESLSVDGAVDGIAREFKVALARQRSSDPGATLQKLVELSLATKSGDLKTTIQINDPATKEELIVDNAAYEYLVTCETRLEVDTDIQLFSIQIGCARV
jgi:hypothetical protein